MKYTEMKFDSSKFLSPSIEYAPIYAWVWNGAVTKEETEKQLMEFQRLGIRRFYVIPEPKQFRPAIMPTELEPDYLTEPYFEEIKYAFDKANEMGMECWLYDEGGWPSGGACGKVLKKHPEYARRVPEIKSSLFMSGDVYKKSSEDVLAAFVDGKIMIDEGYLFENDASVDEYYSKQTLFEAIATPDFPDLSLREATDCFIELTHEKYYNSLKERMGDYITAVFTDEPTLPRPFPLHDGIIKAYEEQYGESPLPYLPSIYGKAEVDEKAAEIRIRWFDLCSRIFCENFLTRCREWSNKHGMEFTGHMDNDHYVTGAMDGGNLHLMRSLRQLDIPGIDVIWRQIFPGESKMYNMGERTSVNGFYPRYASSAAAQQGNDGAMTESCGVYGGGLTYEQMRFVYGYQAIRGVTIFNPMVLLYDRSANMMAGELPLYREDQACHADLSDWNAYLERLSYITTLGKRVCDTALYYPIRDIWAGIDTDSIADFYERLGRNLEAKQIDFDIVDDDIIENATGLENGTICSGNVCYRRIIMPKCKNVSDKSKKNLEIFKANGGIVCEAEESATRPDVIIGQPEELQMMQRKTENGDIYCFFNQGNETTEFVFRLPDNNGYYINITEGLTEPLKVVDGLVHITLCGGETGAVCLTKNIPELFEKTSPAQNTEISGFNFRRINSFEIGELYASSRTIDEASVKAQLGDWSEYAGKEFSGSALYETEFATPICDFDGIVLDLGDVRYTCDVTLNGISLGKKLMPPYRYEISKDLLSDKNHLEIVVKNTVGNQFYYTKSFDKWPDWMVARYFLITKEFDKETLSSGLFGPVKILY